MPRLTDNHEVPCANGKEIKRLRKELGLSQQELAKAIGMNRRTIIRLEKGNAPANSVTIRPLADYFANHFSITRKDLIIGRDTYSEPEVVDNKKWFSIALHVAGDHDTLDIVTLEIQLLDVLGQQFGPGQIRIVEIRESESTIVRLVAKAEAVKGVLSYFERGDFGSTRPELRVSGGYPKWQPVGLVRSVNCMHLSISTAYAALGFRVTTRHPISEVLDELGSKWPRLKFRSIKNRIDATRRRARRPAQAVLS